VHADRQGPATLLYNEAWLLRLVLSAEAQGARLCCGRVAARRPFPAVRFELFSTGGTSCSGARPMSNMQPNCGAGEAFHRRAAVALAVATGLSFESEVALSLGDSPKRHRFDLATPDRRYVGEAKAYAWTASGNVPAAKISALREAVQFLEQLPKEVRRFIIMRRSVRTSTGESLADYFHRLNPQLLTSVSLLELDDAGAVRIVCGSLPSQ